MTCLIANYNTTIPLTLPLPQARGIDIPMLDNVINYNFPDKAKLFLHRVGGCGLDHVMSCDCHVIVAAGRVARAGRTGSAYSLVSTDELPYFIDLHLFISRPVILAKPVLEDDAALGMYVYVLQPQHCSCVCCLCSIPGVYGSVPQSILDDEAEYLHRLHEQNSDLVYTCRKKQKLNIFGYIISLLPLVPSPPPPLSLSLSLVARIAPSGAECSEAVLPLTSSAGAREREKGQKASLFSPHAPYLQ